MNYLAEFEEYFRMLTYTRKAGSTGETAFVNRFVSSIDGIMRDQYGNYWIEILTEDGMKPTTMFTAHTDSVHSANATGKIVIDDLAGIVSVGEGNNCLGADDASGVYLMRHMIDNNIPGLYCFFRDEEIGGKGSSWAYDKETYWKNCDKCISFDRNSYTHDVITHQGWGECCSSMFASKLSMLLATHTGYAYKPDDGGVFTDSANFVDDIPECTNISVGYYNEHTAREEQCLKILAQLKRAVVEIDFEDLPVVRDPKTPTLCTDPYDPAYYDTAGSFRDPEEPVKWVLSDPDFVIFQDLDTYCRENNIPPVYHKVITLITDHIKGHGGSTAGLEMWVYDKYD